MSQSPGKEIMREQVVEEPEEELVSESSKMSEEDSLVGREIRFADEVLQNEPDTANPIESYYNIFENIEKCDEPVIDKMVNQKLLKDQNLKQDKEFLSNLWNQFQKLTKEISELTYANQEEYFVNIQKKLKKEEFIEAHRSADRIHSKQVPVHLQHSQACDMQAI